jgi:hypothetical protein
MKKLVKLTAQMLRGRERSLEPGFDSDAVIVTSRV